MKKTGGLKETIATDNESHNDKPKFKHERRMTLTELKVDI
jgi:hypothetical protein